MNNLILFTNRSGSTILTDLISYSQGTINLGEGLHSLARQYNYNNDIQRQSELYKQFSSTSITARYHNEIPSKSPSASKPNSDSSQK